MAVPLRAIDILRNGRMPAISIALHDDAVGTMFENRPICTFNAPAIPDEPPAIEDVEALRLGGFEPKKPTDLRERSKFCFDANQLPSLTTFANVWYGEQSYYFINFQWESVRVGYAMDKWAV